MSQRAKIFLQSDILAFQKIEKIGKIPFCVTVYLRIVHVLNYILKLFIDYWLLKELKELGSLWSQILRLMTYQSY